MNSTINQVNAGILHTQARMAGMSMDEALTAARVARLASDLDASPHRPTVLRLLRAMWLRHDAEAAANAAASARREDYDARVASAFPAEWAKAEAKTGRARRDSRRELRRRYDANEGV